VNPLVIELIDPFFDPSLTPEEQLFLDERAEDFALYGENLYKLVRQKSRTLSGAPRPRASSITLPDHAGDPIVLEIEYEGADVLLPYLIFNVTDSITGESGTQLIRVVPEPSILLFLGTGLAAAGVRRYRRQRKERSCVTSVRSQFIS
jgi:hypothetical protein